jgi:2-hydroxy-6-oxonona-2,4-dienedioate hydrolase
VLLHGGAGGWMHWIRNIDALAKTHTVWVPDMPGFGDSDLPADNLDADSIAPLVLAGIEEVLQGARFDLVGFSFGSLVAACIATLTPKVDRLVLVSASGLGISPGRPALKSLRGVEDQHARTEVLRFNLNAMMLHDAASVDALAIAVQAKTAVRDRVKNRKIAQTDFILRLAPQWKCPVYGIWGRQDFSYREQFDRLLSTIEQLHLDETVIIDRGGHWVQYEYAAEFNRVLARLLGITSNA